MSPGTEGLPHALRRPAPQAGPRTVVGLFPQYLQLLPNCASRSERPEVPQPDSCTAANTSLVYSITSSARASRAVSADFWVATRSASIFIFLYLGSDVTSAPIQSGNANSWPASASSISANTTPSRSPS